MNIVRKDEWRHGLRCLDCDQKLEDGSPYSKRLLGVVAYGYPDYTAFVTEIVCVPCGMGIKP